MSTSASPPPSTWAMMSACAPRKLSYPKTSRSISSGALTPRALPASTAHRLRVGGFLQQRLARLHSSEFHRAHVNNEPDVPPGDAGIARILQIAHVRKVGAIVGAAG